MVIYYPQRKRHVLPAAHRTGPLLSLSSEKGRGGGNPCPARNLLEESLNLSPNAEDLMQINEYLYRWMDL